MLHHGLVAFVHGFLVRQSPPRELEPALPEVRRGNQLDQRRIELPTGSFDQLLDGLFRAKRVAVFARLRERIENVRDRDDARTQGNRIATQPCGVAVAIPALVV